MLKRYLVVCYGVLVRGGGWSLEEIKGEDKPIVPENYKIAVAEYLVA